MLSALCQLRIGSCLVMQTISATEKPIDAEQVLAAAATVFPERRQNGIRDRNCSRIDDGALRADYRGLLETTRVVNRKIR